MDKNKLGNPIRDYSTVWENFGSKGPIGTQGSLSIEQCPAPNSSSSRNDLLTGVQNKIDVLSVGLKPWSSPDSNLKIGLTRRTEICLQYSRQIEASKAFTSDKSAR